jgi:hypothetical protein
MDVLTIGRGLAILWNLAFPPPHSDFLVRLKELSSAARDYSTYKLYPSAGAGSQSRDAQTEISALLHDGFCVDLGEWPGRDSHR